MSTINAHGVRRNALFRALTASILDSHGIEARPQPVHRAGAVAQLRDYEGPRPALDLPAFPQLFVEADASTAQARLHPTLASAEVAASLLGRRAILATLRRRRDGTVSPVISMDADTFAELLAKQRQGGT